MKFNKHQLKEIDNYSSAQFVDKNIIHRFLQKYTTNVTFSRNLDSKFILLGGVVIELLSLTLEFLDSRYCTKAPDLSIILISSFISFFYIIIQCIALDQAFKSKMEFQLHTITEIICNLFVFEIESCKICLNFVFKVSTTSLYFMIFMNAFLFISQWKLFCQGLIPFSREKIFGFSELMVLFIIFNIESAVNPQFFHFIKSDTALAIFYVIFGIYLIHALIVSRTKSEKSPKGKKKIMLFTIATAAVLLHSLIEGNVYDDFIKIPYIISICFTIIFIIMIFTFEIMIKTEMTTYTKFAIFLVAALVVPLSPFYLNDYDFWIFYVVVQLVAIGLSYTQVVVGLHKRFIRKSYLSRSQSSDFEFASSDFTDVPLSNEASN